MVSGSFCLCCGETQCEQLPKIQAGTTADEKKPEEKKATYPVDLSEDEVEVGSISATEPAAPALCGATAGNTRTQRRRAQRKKGRKVEEAQETWPLSKTTVEAAIATAPWKRARLV